MVLINIVNVDILNSVLNWFKDSDKITTKIVV